MRSLALVLLIIGCSALVAGRCDGQSIADLSSISRPPIDVSIADGCFDLGLGSMIRTIAYGGDCDHCCDEPFACDAVGGKCHGCFGDTTMLGDWHGVKSGLAEYGIIANLELTQFYQGITSGGRSQHFKYGGKLDYQLTFLGEQLGLWKGFTTVMHAETQFGESLAGDAGAFSFPNTSMLYPLPGESETAITGLLFLQSINERISLFAGKVNVLDFWTAFYPNVGRGVDGFMNLNSLASGLPWLRFVNLSVNAGGLLFTNGMRPQGFVAAMDTNNSTTTSGISNLFDSGAVVLSAWKFFTDFGGKPGSVLFAGGYSNRTYTALDPTSWSFIPGQGGGLTPGQKTGAWSMGVYLDQVVWADGCNENRKVQLFTGASISDGDPSFVRWNWFGSLEAFGLVRCRPRDRMGISYFYNEVSNDLKQLVAPVEQLENLHGGEFYYNASITPWMYLTGDLQVVDGMHAADDTALILGARLHLDL